MSCKWFLVRTQPRRERTAEEHITRQGAEVYLPRFYDQGKRTLLFPSYLFTHYCEISYSWLENTIGVSVIVRMGADPVIVPQKLIDHVRWLEGQLSTDPVDRSIKVGDVCHVLNGPFAAINAICDGMLPGARVSLLMSIFGRRTRVDCDMRDVISDAAAA